MPGGERMFDEARITIVSGIPRSGTSMMMSMLAAGGVPLLSDGRRCADEDNPAGYFEFEPVARLAWDTSWLSRARGRAVKIISQFLPHVPVGGVYSYNVLLMVRDPQEVMASQERMMRRLGTWRAGLLDGRTPDRFAAHHRRMIEILSEHRCFRWLAVDYNEVLLDPSAAADRVDGLLGGGLDVEAMANVPSAELKRHGTSVPRMP